MIAPAVESRIDAVTVFSHGARVTRVATIRAEGGRFPSAIRVPGLPLAADDGSFRVRVEPARGGASSGLPIARDLRVALDVPEVVTEEKPPDERAVDEARREEARLEVEIAQVERDLRRLEELALAPRPSGRKGEPPPESPTAARLALVEFVSLAAERLAGERQQLREKRREAKERRKDLEDRLRRASSDRPVPPHALRKTVVVQLGTEDGTAAVAPARLLIDYTVPGARWAPSYAVRLRPDGSAAGVAVRAVVAQRSGEDWNGVRLTLSTARPERWADLPKLASLRIGRQQPVAAPVGWRPPPTGAEELYRDWDRAFAGPLHDEEPGPPRLSAAPEAVEAELFEMDADGAPGIGGPAVAAAAAFGALGGAEEELTAELSMPVGSAPPPAATAMPASAPRSVGGGFAAMSRAPRARRPEPGVTAPDPAGRPSGVRARDDMLDYGTLRMAPARSGRRGHLVVTDRLHLYLELMVEREVDVELDVVDAVAKATRRAEGAGPKLPARHHVATSDDGFDYAYVAETPADIPSDRHYHSVPLLERAATAAIRHVAVPRESTDVFRVARFENPLPGPLLRGPADVSLGDEFLVTTDVAATPEGAAVSLGLGVDQAVKVSRNTRYREETAGLTRGSLALGHEIAIDVQSHASHPVQVEVRERVPTTRKDEKEIDVEIGEVTPAWEPWEPEAESGQAPLKGGHRWLVSLEPGEKKELRAVYRVRISSKHELVGGNRREHS